MFFLAEIESRTMRGNAEVFVLGRELVRDISVAPALSRGSTVIARRHISALLLYGRFEEYRALKPGRGECLRFAFECSGLTPAATASQVDAVVSGELESYIHHEFGEDAVMAELGSIWRDMSADHACHAGGLSIRSVKDVLADTHERGMVRHMIDEDKGGSFGLYVTWLSGLRHRMTAPLRQAYLQFMRVGDWQAVERARVQCHEEARELAERLIAQYEGTGSGEQVMQVLKEHMESLS